HELDGQARLRVADLADLAAELGADELPRGDEVDLGDPQVAAGAPIDELVDERDVVRLDGVAAGRELSDQPSVAEAQRALVGLDGDLRLLGDGGVRVLVHDQALEWIGAGDRHLPDAALDEVDDAHAVDVTMRAWKPRASRNAARTAGRCSPGTRRRRACA